MKKNRLMVAVLLAGGLLAFSPTMAQDQTIKLVTSKSVGDEITFIVNKTIQPYSVDWGDGQFVEVSATESGNQTITGTLKGTTVTIKGSEYWDMLTCSGLDLTALDVTGAPSLRSLYCQNNALTTLNLSNAKALTDLNAANNQLTALEVTATLMPDLENVNLAGNQLTGQFSYTGSGLQHVNIANNQYERAYFTSNTNLDVVNCGGNQLSSLSLLRNADITAAICDGNKLTSLQLPSAGLENLAQLVCDDNSLSRLNLSNCPQLNALSCGNNNLSELSLPDVKLYSLDCANNKLSFSALPASRNYVPEHLNFVPQATIDVTADLPVFEGLPYVMKAPTYEDATSEEYQIDLSDHVGATVIISWYSVDAADNKTKLTASSSASKMNDFRNSSGKYAFFNTFDKVYAELTSRIYTDITLATTAFSVRDENSSGIGDITADDAAFSVKVSNGALVMTSATAVNAAVYAVDGKKVWNGTVDASGVSLSLPKGAYVVNGKKVIL